MTEMTFDQLCELFAYTPKGRPLDSAEVAEILQVHEGTIRQHRLRGDGPPFYSPPGTRRVWYAERDVLAWLASGAKRSTSEQVAA
jgi:DNA-binding CsgD family transcriptional regulator